MLELTFASLLQYGLPVPLWQVRHPLPCDSIEQLADEKPISLLDKARLILKATRQHARNLAAFAATYKAIMLTLRSISPTRKEESSHAFLAGLVGGYLVFGRGIQSSVNQQIVIYVFARAVLSMAKLMMQIHHSTGMVAQFKSTISKNAWPVFAGLSWATIMWMFRWHPQTIQPSLRSSMKYMYVILRFFFQEKKINVHFCKSGVHQQHQGKLTRY